MTTPTVPIGYEVRWTWHGEHKARRFATYEEAVACAVIESGTRRVDTLLTIVRPAGLRPLKQATLYAIGPSYRRKYVGTFEKGQRVERPEWD